MSEDTPGEHRITTDRATIRQWADDHDVVPVRGTSGDVEFVPPADADEDNRLDWDEFEAEMGDSDHVVLREEHRDERPMRVTDRDTVVSRTDMSDEDIEQALVEGEVVTGEITETRTVERTIVERAELRSELVDTEIVDERVVDVDLMSRECTNCSLTAAEGAGETDWFDTDHYIGSRTEEGTMTGPGVDVGMAPYMAELDVEERYRVARELTERFTIETRIADTDVSEMDTLTSDDVDVEGLHHSIVDSDLFRAGEGHEEHEERTHTVSHDDLETEFVEGDRLHTYVDRRLTVEDEVLDRKRLTTRIDEVADHEIELLESTGTGTTATEMEGDRRVIEHGGAMAGTTTGAEMDETAGDERPMDATADEPTTQTTAEEHTTGAGHDEARASGTAPREGDYRTNPTEDDEGKEVVDSTGEKVGMVVEVDEAEGVAHVDPHPGITDRIKATLDMGEADEESFRLREERIERITDDHVELESGPETGTDTGGTGML